jgi:hypothetical protein
MHPGRAAASNFLIRSLIPPDPAVPACLARGPSDPKKNFDQNRGTVKAIK